MRFYLIGAGVIDRTHAEAIYKLQEERGSIEIKVADPNPAALAAFAERFPEALAFADAKEMLREEPREDDIAIVGTPPFTHFALSKLALESGRHVLCEKPLVMNGKEAEALLEIARANDRLLGCCSVRFLHVPKTEEVKRLLGSGELGDVYKISFVFRGQRADRASSINPKAAGSWTAPKARGRHRHGLGAVRFLRAERSAQPIEVAAAWISKPETEIDPTDAVYDIEGHVGAMLKFRQDGGKTVWVQYERASWHARRAVFLSGDRRDEGRREMVAVFRNGPNPGENGRARRGGGAGERDRIRRPGRLHGSSGAFLRPESERRAVPSARERASGLQFPGAAGDLRLRGQREAGRVGEGRPCSRIKDFRPGCTAGRRSTGRTDWIRPPEAIFRSCAEAGLQAVEADPTDEILALAKRFGLVISGAYIGLQLHERYDRLNIGDTVLPTAKRLAAAGGTDLVINADPKGGWDEPQPKTEEEFKRQGDICRGSRPRRADSASRSACTTTHRISITRKATCGP